MTALKPTADPFLLRGSRAYVSSRRHGMVRTGYRTNGLATTPALGSGKEPVMPQESDGGRPRRRSAASPSKSAGKGDQTKRTRRLRLIPLGGVGEVGKNCLLLEQGSDMVLIDVGVKFPEEELLGIDLIIPDLSYVAEHVEQLRAIVITHGHEDHLGALPFVLRQLNSAYPVPVYGSRLVLGMARAKLEEHRALALCDLQEIDFGTKVHLGS